MTCFKKIGNQILCKVKYILLKKRNSNSSIYNNRAIIFKNINKIKENKKEVKQINKERVNEIMLFMFIFIIINFYFNQKVINKTLFTSINICYHIKMD